MRKNKVTYDEYISVLNEYYFEKFFYGNLNVEYKQIIDNYKKQNKYNIFQFIDESHYKKNKYQRKSLFFTKYMFVSLILYMISIFSCLFFDILLQNYILVGSTLNVIISVVLFGIYDHKYTYLTFIDSMKPPKTKREIRIEKLKNILNKEE